MKFTEGNKKYEWTLKTRECIQCGNISHGKFVFKYLCVKCKAQNKRNYGRRMGRAKLSNEYIKDYLSKKLKTKKSILTPLTIKLCRIMLKLKRQRQKQVN